MFEVNFFEKKQRNFLPYVLGGAFLFLLVLVGIYFFSAQAYYTKTEIRDQEWLQAEEEQLVSRQMQEYAQLTEQVAENKATFEETISNGLRNKSNRCTSSKWGTACDHF